MSKFWRNSTLKTLKKIQRNSFKSIFQDLKFYWNRTQKPPQTSKSPKSLKLNGSSLQSSKEFPSKSLLIRKKIFKEHLKNNKSLTSSRPKIYCENHLVYLSSNQCKEDLMIEPRLKEDRIRWLFYCIRIQIHRIVLTNSSMKITFVKLFQLFDFQIW